MVKGLKISAVNGFGILDKLKASLEEKVHSGSLIQVLRSLPWPASSQSDRDLEPNTCLILYIEDINRQKSPHGMVQRVLTLVLTQL